LFDATDGGPEDKGMVVRNHRTKQERGFTLVELLVVIAIIGILVALLLPAIQAAREAARRAQCQSNLKNVALAVLNYESANKKFPPGFLAQPSSNEAWGWAVFILPYLEDQAIYDQLRPSTTFIAPVDGTRKGKRNLADVFAAGASNPQEIVPLQTPIPVFRCPSDSTPALVPCDGSCGIINPAAVYTDTGQWVRSFMGVYANGLRTKPFLPSASNYVGNHGTVDSPCTGSTDGSGNWIPNQAICNGNGVFFANSQVGLKQITDGTDKTFLAGERDHYCQAGTWIGARETADSQMHSYLWTLGHAFNPPNMPQTLAYDSCVESFSSSHKGGLFFAFCDGSVHYINDDIDSNPQKLIRTCIVNDPSSAGCKSRVLSAVIGVYQRLAWKDDGEVIDDVSL
jgi:prepilin-type N-terminal cleavage/methylation domain-containing protein